jgi:hypothetical protein
MTTPGSTRSKLRETLKQEDSSLSERLPAVAAPPAIETKLEAVKKAARAPAAAPRKAARPAAAPQAVQEPALKPAARTVVVTVAESAPPVEPRRRKPSAAAKAGAGKKGKPGKEKPGKGDKVVRDSFSMPASEHKRIKALREVLARTGCEASKSEVLRAGLALLAARDLSEVVRIVGALPRVPKGKRGKKA